MTRAVVVRLTLSALGIVCTVLVLLSAFGFWRPTRLPVRIERSPNGAYVLRSGAGSELPSPLVDGDVLDLEAMSPASRAALLPEAYIRQGTSIQIAVARNGGVLRVPLTFTSSARSQAERVQLWVGGVAMMPLFLLCALLTLWRGRSVAAWGLSVFSLASLLNNGLDSIPAMPLASFWIVQIRYAVVALTLFPAVYMTAEALAYSGLSPRLRTTMRVSLATLAMFIFGVWAAEDLALGYLGIAQSPSLESFAGDLFPVLLAIPVLALVLGYRHSGHASRLRIRWVLASTILLLLATVAPLAIPQARHADLYRIIDVTQGFVMLGYVYAVLRTRLIDVSFVVNRALVFASITAVLFGVFSLLELALHQFAVGERLSWILQGATALIFAIALSPLHRRIEHWVEKLLFHRQRLAIGSVRRFAAECAFVEHEHRLLEMAVQRLAPQCAAVAVYERTPSAYKLRASRGHAWPETVDVDDPLFVSLRAQRKEVDVRRQRSSISADALAYPMTVAEALTGALICRPHDGEQFTSDAREALAEAARNLGMSLYILRNREQARLVADIAAGRIEEAAARTRALALAGE
ncbi:MAG: hypothetical protein ACREV7_16340 [Steroidobacteraceae bacterium]